MTYLQHNTVLKSMKVGMNFDRPLPQKTEACQATDCSALVVVDHQLPYFVLRKALAWQLRAISTLIPSRESTATFCDSIGQKRKPPSASLVRTEVTARAQPNPKNRRHDYAKQNSPYRRR